MSYEEVRCYVNCPHCGHTNYVHFELNFSALTEGSVYFGIRKAKCFNCLEEFWFNSYCFLEVQIYSVFKKEPKINENLKQDSAPL